MKLRSPFFLAYFLLSTVCCLLLQSVIKARLPVPESNFVVDVLASLFPNQHAMKCCSLRFGLALRLLALSVSLAVVVSSYAFVFASSAKTARNSVGLNTNQAVSPNSELTLTSVSATATKTGVLLHWSTNSVPDNLGFNIYRVGDGQRTRVNKEIIPGALFAAGTPALMRGGYSYAWFDRGGTAANTYFIESVNVAGAARMQSDAISPVASRAVSEFEQTPGALNGGSASANESADMFEKRYPAEEASLLPGFASTTIQDQWAIAAQTALKIAIKKDGWYRVTQPQMVAAGFNPTVDIRNLRLFVEGQEVAISTSQSSGQFRSGDYIEFYGRGLDLPTTDKRTYYLVAGTTPGKRVSGDIQGDGDPILPPPPTPVPTPELPPAATPTPVPAITPAPVTTPPEVTSSPEPSRPVLRDPVFYGWVQNDLNSLLEARNSLDKRETKEPEAPRVSSSSPVTYGVDNPTADRSADYSPDYSKPGRVEVQMAGASRDNSTAATNKALSVSAPATRATVPQPAAKASRQVRKRAGARKRTRRAFRRQRMQENSHAAVAAGFAPVNYAYTIETKERFVYLSNLLNGDEENFFGHVISSPVTQPLAVSNPDSTATTSATLEFALQGVMSQAGNPHDVRVDFNGVTIGSVQFQPLEHPVRTFSIPMSQVLSGNNNLVFTKTSTGEVCIVDYIHFTYPHTFKADAGSLKFNLRGSQTLKVDGFSTPLVRLIDYTDPFNVSMTKPAAESSVNGFAITVPTSALRSKAQRLLYAISQGQFEQAAALTLSTPSTLNANTNAANFLILSHKNFIPSFTTNVPPANTKSLVEQRQSQGFAVSIVDIDDVYDEFSYGVHGPQAIRDFLQHAATHWATVPRYIIFAGDASLDPRNYQNIGDFDFVPTKLVDATFNETASDDWLADFDDDGIANIPIGRLPVRTLADANLVLSKIVNYTPPPQTAMLFADEDEFNIFGFAQTNDSFQSLLPASMTVQRLNRSPQPQGVPSQNVVKADIVNAFNAGPALVNYSGHGNVDVWTGASLFTTSDALLLTNGNRLPFVVVMDCLNGYFQDASLLSLSEAWLKAPNGGAVAAFASSGLTIAQGQHEMGQELYTQLYSGAPMALGDAIKIAKGATFDIDVKRTWIFFGDPSMKIR